MSRSNRQREGRNFVRFVILFLIFAFPLFSQTLYNDTTITELRLSFYCTSWKDSLVKHVASETDIPGRLTVNNVIYDSIGVRYKGNSSYNVQSEKKPFNLSIDGYKENQLLDGYKTLNLNNFFKDPTCVREKIAYEIASRYFPAVKAAYAKLYVNNEYWGLYLNVQQINKIFLREHFVDRDGNMYKGDPPNSAGGSFGADLTWHGADTSYYRARYELKTNEDQNDWSDLVRFINVLNTLPDAAFEAEIVRYLNVDRALWYLAYCNIFVNLDSYLGSGHNYYLYDSALEGMDIILWDINEVLGTFSSEQLTIEQREKLPLLYKNLDVARPLVKRLLAVSSFRQRYYARCRVIMNETLLESFWQPRVQKYQQLINASLNADTRKLYTMGQFSTNVTTDIVSSGQGPAGTIPGVLSFVNHRRTFLSTLPEIIGIVPNVVSLQHSPAPPAPSDSVSFQAIIRNAASASIWWSVNYSRFQKRTMTRSTSDSTLFRVTFPPFSRNDYVRYYVEAVGSSGASEACPSHAEYVTQSFAVAGTDARFPIVINELMASNTKTVKDQQNQYDDWIELHNTSGDTVSVARMYLSDELKPKRKWEIPAKTVIPPKGYLLVWADEDTADVGGLHANFKLSKSGEAVFLWDTTASAIVDSTAFGAQVDDKSWARIPDGTGAFWITDATPNSPNVKTVNISGEAVSPDTYALSQNYPNPFNPSTVVSFQLPSVSFVSLKVFDVTGKEVARLVEGNKDRGRHEVRWNTTSPSGIYFYRLQVRPLSGGRAGELVETKKMVLLR
jgi:hypothetical protein